MGFEPRTFQLGVPTPLTATRLPAPVLEMLLFNSDVCSAPTMATTPYEVTRAQEVNGQLGPKGSEKAVDLICDLHNTTANMGLCIITHVSDWLGLHLFKYLQVSAAPYALLLRNLKGPYFTARRERDKSALPCDKMTSQGGGST